MGALSKSKLLAFRQRPKRLWLEINRQKLRTESKNTQRNFKAGHLVGGLARRLYDAKEKGEVLDPFKDGFPEAIAPATSATRKIEIGRQLLDYCKLETFAMVRLWQFLNGHPPHKIGK